MAEFRVLGPLEVIAGGGTLQLGGLKQRTVLAVLTLQAGEVVSTDAIADAVWGDARPRSATALVRTYISRLRQVLSAATGGAVDLVNRPPGYMLAADPGDVDACHFEHLVVQARQMADAGSFDRAAATLRHALDLWRGDVLADLAEPESLRPAITRLEEMRRVAVEDRFDAELALGHHAEMVGELEAVTAQHPFRERLWRQLIVALYRSERQADALAAYQRARANLVDEVGIDPGPELRGLEHAVLTQAADLDWRAPPGPPDHEPQQAPSERRPVPLPAALAEGPDDPPPVGRSAERRVLSRSLDVARAGRFGAVFVEGPPGIGKTTLVARFAREAHANGATVVFGRADQGAPLAFQALREAIRGWVSGAPLDDLRLLGEEDAAPLGWLVPAFAERRGAPPPAPMVGGELDRYLLFETFARWLGALAARCPAVVVLDDLHWADPATLRALHHLLRHPPQAGALLVATHRDTELEHGHQLAEVLASLRGDRHVRRLTLEGLRDDDVAGLVRAQTGGDLGPAGEAFADKLHRRTGGNPLFVQETLRHLVERGAILPDAGEWATGQPFDAFGVPSGVREVIEQRLGRLPASTTTVLRQASVLGDHFDVAVLSRMVAVAQVATIEALEPAVAARLVVQVGSHGDGIAFSHSLVREAILDSLPLSVRARAHWQAGLAISSVHASHPERHRDEVARHLAAGVSAGDPHLAITANVEAGEHALTALAFEDADGRFTTAADLLDTTGTVDPELAYRAWLGVGRTANALADARRRRTGYRHAAAVAREQHWSERLARVAIDFGAYIAVTGEMEQQATEGEHEQFLARDLLDEALTSLDETPSLDRCLLLAIKAMRSVVFDRNEEASDLATSATEAAGSVEDPKAVACALTARSWTLLGAPQPRELSETVERALSLPAPTQGSVPFSDHLLAVQPVPALQLGDRREFDACRSRLASHPATRRSVHLSASVRCWDAALALARGRFEQAKDLTASVHGTASWPLWVAAGSLQAAVALYERGHYASLTPRLTTYLASAPDAIALRAMLASLHAQAGDRAEAAHQIDTLCQQRRLDMLGWSAPLTLRHLAEAATLVGNPELVTDLLAVLEDYSGQMLTSFTGMTIDGAADRAIGQLLLVLGRLDEATERLAAGQVMEQAFDAHALAARTAYWHARARAERRGPGDREAARKLLGEASAHARRLGMAGLEQDIEALTDQQL